MFKRWSARDFDRAMLNDPSVRMPWTAPLDPIVHSVRYFRDIYNGGLYGASHFKEILSLYVET